LGSRCPAQQYPFVALLSRDRSLLVSDVQSDRRLDEVARRRLMEKRGQAAAFIPLSVGDEWLGYVMALVRQPHVFTETESRMYEAVSDQAAIALRSLRLLDDAENRARRERIIREITTKMGHTVELDSILDTAVRELGRALGVSRAFVRLSAGSEAGEPGRDGPDEPRSQTS
jgi:GAF domain-containing protein